MSTLMISVQAVKDRTRLASGLDPNIMRPTMSDAQRLHMLPILGGGLYDKIIADIDSSSLSGAYETLVQTYVWPALTNWILVEGLDDWHYRIEGAMVGVRNSDNMTAASEPEINRLKDRYRSRARIETIRLIDYICDNQSSFPEYGKEGAVSGNICPATQLDYQTPSLDYAVRTQYRELKRWRYDRKR